MIEGISSKQDVSLRRGVKTIVEEKPTFSDGSAKLSGAKTASEFFGTPITNEENISIELVQKQNLQTGLKDKTQPLEPNDVSPEIIEGEVQTTTEIKALKVAATENINNVLANPENFSAQQINVLQQDLLNILAGRNWEEFTQQEGDSELISAIETLRTKMEEDRLRQTENVLQISNVLGVELPNSSEEMTINNEDIKSLEQDKDKEELAITANENGEEKTISIKKMAVLAGLIALDLAFFKGGFFDAVISVGETTREVAHLAYGISKDEHYLHNNLGEQLIEVAEPHKLIDFLKKRKDDEMHKFLLGLKKDTRKKMLSGERFGGLFGRHKLDQNQIEMVLSQLDDNQKKDLNIPTS